MHRKDVIFGILILAAVALFFMSPQAGLRLRGFLAGSPGSTEDQNSLASENIALKAQLALLENLESQIPKIPAGTIVAQVYSRYPFNLKNELLIDRGMKDGVETGAPVYFAGIFIGEVENAYPSSALIETIFDERVEYSVRVGKDAADALLKGGNEPKLTLIDKKSAISSGDAVVNATPKIAYGAPIGTIDAVTLASGGLFQEATLDFSYDINSIRNVGVGVLNAQ